MLGNASKIRRRKQRQRATSGKQDAKRSQWAGRFVLNFTRDENNVGGAVRTESCLEVEIISYGMQ